MTLHSKVVVGFDRFAFQTKQDVRKALKRIYHTCLAFEIDLEIVMPETCFDFVKDAQYSFPIHRNFRDVGYSDVICVLEPRRIVEERVDNVIGSNFQTLEINDFPGSSYLFIDTPKDYPLWQEVALGILLYDRDLKFWRGIQ